ncbi:putative phage abortive infection protein [Chryseobacterium sp. SIMBA_028]|uniref:putative phage abortive infection protein n=1 Tax=Chryseobacterium sp. SIMBA_028 TaxID=3085771 RepID=UPI00397884ED
MKNNNWVFWIIGLVSIIFMAIVLWLNYSHAINLGKDYQGLFGDMFGASNAVFTGLSFVGVIIAILLQRQDLKETKEEVVNQNKTLMMQRFETIFFNLVSNHHQIVSDLRSKDYTTKDGVKIYTYYISREVFKQHIEYLLLNIDDDIDTFESQYSEFFKNNGYEYAHCLKNLYQILNYVDNQKFEKQENEDFQVKRKYIEILWNQLSDNEIAMIFYHSAHCKFMPGFRFIIEKYSLFEDVNDQLLFNEIKKFYSEKAFNRKAS